MDKHFIIILFISFHFSTLAQTQFQGRVLKKSDSLPLSGVSIYYDGTSMGVSTGEDGSFEIQSSTSVNSPLIIYAMGYKTIIKSHLQNGTMENIYLEESLEELGEVFLESDPWSHKKKLDIFRREFLGKLPPALACRITNEEVIKLRYIPSTKPWYPWLKNPCASLTGIWDMKSHMI